MTDCYCGSTSSTLVRTRIRGGKERKIVRCDRCGVIRKGDLDTRQHRELHENNKQVEEINLETLSEEYRERNLVDIDRRIEAIKPYLSGDENVLDIGTGMGHFLDQIEPYVNEVVGTEINDTRISFIRDQLGYPVYEGTDEVLDNFEEGHFDIVTMFHALEHLINPVEQLQSLHSVLDDDGRLFVEVPNHDDYLLNFSDSYSDFYYQDAHSYYFDLESLDLVLILSGYKTDIMGVQRYSVRNALHWLLEGEPEIDEPSRYQDTWKDPVDKLYGTVLTRMNRSDTLWATCQSDKN